ncbi:MAG: cadmium resistance transporter [Thermoproteota archaeon]|nr:cadmium resistance transporter [Thermoproteota archaeon]
MGDFFGILGIGATAFVATNIDDLLILIAFFANSHFPLPQIVLGQYAGMGALLAIGVIGSLIALIVPNNLIGLIGIFPIAIGIKELLELLRNGDNEESAKQLSRSRLTAYLPFLTVAAVTFSGGEEIGVYTSVFATYHQVSEIIIIVLVVMVLTGLWCAVAYHLVNRPLIASSIKRTGTVALPFVLIGLGIYILAEAFLIPSLLLSS